MTLHRIIRHVAKLQPTAETQPGRARTIWIVVLSVALIQGLLYLVLLPPWQHYDEPTHFEYAWLFAQLGHPPTHGDQDQAMRHAVALSMREHNFYHNLPAPNLGDTYQEGDYIDIGLSQLDHPPGYYALVSLPLRFASHLDITSQLYIARSVSLLLFITTITIAAGLMGELTPPGHILRLVVPITIALLPGVADVMTAVNNDVGSVAAASLLLWGMVRTIRVGLKWYTIAWVIAAALLTVVTKNTAAVLVLLVPLVVLVTLWVQQGWSWRWFVGAALAAGILLVIAVLDWGDAAYWYRWTGAATQHAPTQIAHPDAPAGTHAVVLTASVEHDTRRLINPVLAEDVESIRGQSITLGGWFWADQTRHIEALGLAPAERIGFAIDTHSIPITVTTEPVFVAWTFDVPSQTEALHYVFTLPSPQNNEQPYHLFLDGAVLAIGTFPAAASPIFDDATARSGTWGGQPFTNLLRNGSAEQAGPRLRPWVEQTLVHSISLGGGRTPSQLLMALWDIERTGDLLVRYGGTLPLDGMISTFGWGHVRLGSPAWVFAFRGIVVVALLGCLKWGIALHHSSRSAVRPAVVVLGLAGVLVWGITFLRVIPLISEGFAWPVARYTFPAIIPTTLALVGGWWYLWPRRYRVTAVAALIIGIVILNSVALITIWSFYHGVRLSQ